MEKRSSAGNVEQQGSADTTTDQTTNEQRPDESASTGPSGPAADESLAPGVAKNPAAVSLGRLGGLKGGKARAKILTPEERSDAARKAAAARWHKTKAEK